MTPAGGGRDWVVVAALALATVVLSVVQPALLIFLPLALLLVALPPQQPALLAFAGVIGWLTFARAAEAAAPGALWYFGRGWALVLGAWFVLAVALRPRTRFLPNALGALAGTMLTAAAVAAVNRSGFAAIDAAVAGQFRSAASSALTTWTGALGLDRVSDEVQRTVYAAAELQIRLYPAMLALGSVAALAVAWWGFVRLTRREERPLRPLREFRFRDELVWLLIAGLVLLVLPLSAVATRTGENLLSFMAVLYALRGAAVLLVIGGVPGPLGMVVMALLIVFMYPFVMATAFLVGLSDTWLDIRARRALRSEQ